MSPRFFSVFMRVSGLLRADFSKSPHRGCPTPKRAKKTKTASLFLLGKRFCHFLDTGREMIFDCLSGISWGLTGEGGVGVWPVADSEKQNGKRQLLPFNPGSYRKRNPAARRKKGMCREPWRGPAFSRIRPGKESVPGISAPFFPAGKLQVWRNLLSGSHSGRQTFSTGLFTQN